MGKDKIFTTFLAILFLGCLAFSDTIDPTYNYDKFMTQFNRTYEGEQKNQHQQIFNANYAELLRTIESGVDCIVSDFLDWNQTQISSKPLFYIDLLNYRPEISDVPLSTRPVLSSSALFTSPSTFDYRTLGRVTDVRHQGTCGSCWAFATTAQYESCLAIATNGVLYDLSEQYGLQCDTYSLGCQGGYPYRTLELMRNTGIPLESAYPYKGQNNFFKNQNVPICTNTSRVKLNKTISGVSFLSSYTVEQLQQDLVTYGPITVGVFANNFAFMNVGSTGMISCSSSGNIDHAVLLVGYTTTHWIIKNSWGTNWGNGGYGFISKTADCGLRTYINILQVNYGSNPSPNPNPNPNPTPVTNVTLTVTMSDSYGDGWHGNTIAFKQNGVIVGSFGAGFTTGRNYGPVSITLNGKLETQIVVGQAAPWRNQIGFVIKFANNTQIFTRTSGLSYDPSVIFKTFCPLGGCPISTTSNFYLTLTDSWGDGWNGNVLGIRQNGAVKSSFTLTSGYLGGPILVVLQKFKPAEIIVVTWSSWTNQIGFIIRSESGAIIAQRNPSIGFTANSILGTFTPGLVNESPVSQTFASMEQIKSKQEVVEPQKLDSKNIGLIAGLVVAFSIAVGLGIGVIIQTIKLMKLNANIKQTKQTKNIKIEQASNIQNHNQKTVADERIVGIEN